MDKVKRLVFIAPFIFDIVDDKFDIWRNLLYGQPVSACSLVHPISYMARLNG